MIKINRLSAPFYFQSPEIQLAKQELQERFLSSSQERIKFNPSILEPIRYELLQAFNFKCAYCETTLDSQTDWVIENFRPKDGCRGLSKDFWPQHYYWLAYEWENLYTCCKDCEKYKSNVFPLVENAERAAVGVTGEELYREEILLVDPCRDRPEEHLSYDDQCNIIGLTRKGQVTIEVLGLNRASLQYSRKKEVDQIIRQLERFKPKNTGDMQAFVNELISSAAFKSYTVALTESVGNWLKKNKLDLVGDLLGIIAQPFASIIKSIDLEPEKNIGTEKKEIQRQLSALKRFTIKSVRIKNFKNIDDLTLEILPASHQDAESWLLLLGDNGIGKTSILQAIALTLSEKTVITALKVNARDILKSKKKKGLVQIQSWEHDQPIELHFDRKGFTHHTRGPLTFLLGYGSTRLLPKGGVRAGRYLRDYSNIGNLFDYTAALTNVNKWLSTVDPGEFETRIAPALFDLLDMKEGDKVQMKSKRLILYQHGEYQDLHRTSDGYQTIVGLACDIMKTLSLDKANYHTTQGIVLIDELGNHLHPRWRMRIVKSLRRAFPKLQFIVSTHEPLCLRGLLHGEVDVLLRDSTRRVRVLDRKLLPDHNLLRVDQLLTSDLFGLINTLDPDMEKKYEDYYDLLSRPEEKQNDADKERILRLTEELSINDLIGATPQMQVLYKVVNETYAKNARERITGEPDLIKPTETIKQETANEVIDLLNDPNFSWK